MYPRFVLLGVLVASLAAVAFVGAAHRLAVVRPGGPPATDQAQQQVAGLLAQLGAAAGWPAGSTDAAYFNTTEAGLKHIQQVKPGFVLATPGFYLAYRQTLKLRPINQVVLPEGDTSRYFVVVRQGTAARLADLKGQTLAGAHLAEPKFIERIVLDGALAFGKDVTVQAMSGLSALRQLSKGEVFAVIVDAKEHQAMAALPFAADLAVVFTSEPLPNTGIMAVGGNASPSEIEALRRVAPGFCASPTGAPICRTFEIKAFANVDESLFADLIRRWDS